MALFAKNTHRQTVFSLAVSLFCAQPCFSDNNSVHHKGNETSILWGLVLIDLVHRENYENEGEDSCSGGPHAGCQL